MMCYRINSQHNKWHNKYTTQQMKSCVQYHPHTITERDSDGGRDIEYLCGVDQLKKWGLWELRNQSVVDTERSYIVYSDIEEAIRLNYLELGEERKIRKIHSKENK